MNNDILQRINQVLIEEDPMGLIKIGAPLDEYDSEALMIYERINRLDSVYQIQEKLWNVFYSQFCLGGVMYKTVEDEMIETGYSPPMEKKEAESMIGGIARYFGAAEKIKKILGE